MDWGKCDGGGLSTGLILICHVISNILISCYFNAEIAMTFSASCQAPGGARHQALGCQAPQLAGTWCQAPGAKHQTLGPVNEACVKDT